MGGSTTTSKQQYPSFVEGFGKDFFKDASKAFNKGPSYYKGSTVTPFSNQTMAAFGLDEKGKPTGSGMLGLAEANSGTNGMGGSLQQIMSNGGFNQGQLDTMGQIRGLANNSGLAELINGNGLTGAQNKSYDSLQDTVYGNNNAFQQTFNQGGLTADQQSVADKYRAGMNEQFGTDAAYNTVKQNALDSAAQGVTAQAAKAGRFGGGANQNILARAQGDLSANMDTAEMDKYRARTQAAAGNLAGLSQTGLGNQMGINSAQQSGLQNVTNMGAMGVDQRNNAISMKSGLENSLFNMNQAGLGNMGTAYQTAMQPYQTQRAIGQQQEDLYTRQMQDKLRIKDAQNPFNHLQQYASLLSGAPTNSVQTTTPSTLQMLLGGGLGAAGLLGGMGVF